MLLSDCAVVLDVISTDTVLVHRKIENIDDIFVGRCIVENSVAILQLDAESCEREIGLTRNDLVKLNYGSIERSVSNILERRKRMFPPKR